MNKMKDTITTVIGTIVVCGVFSIIVPELRMPFLVLGNVIKEIFIEFYQEDILKAIILYIVIAGIITTLGFSISDKTENEIWSVIAIILDIVSFIMVVCL